MDELHQEIDLEAWTVNSFAPGFAARVLARMDDDDHGDLDEELEGMVRRLMEDDAVHEDAVLLRPAAQTHARGRGLVWVAAAAAAAAAMVLLWIAARMPAGDAVRPSSPAVSPPEPPVASPTAVAADLDRDSIRKAVREQFIPKAKACYDALLMRESGAQGRVTLRFGVVRRAERGIVDRVSVEDGAEIKDAVFQRCLADAMLDVVFEPPGGGDRVEIVYPIIFRLPGPGSAGGVIVGG
ncbi:MAG: AgmX/PglI C-terminal domain-containing protein [Myxococcota bacterium]